MNYVVVKAMLFLSTLSWWTHMPDATSNLKKLRLLVLVHFLKWSEDHLCVQHSAWGSSHHLRSCKNWPRLARISVDLPHQKAQQFWVKHRQNGMWTRTIPISHGRRGTHIMEINTRWYQKIVYSGKTFQELRTLYFDELEIPTKEEKYKQYVNEFLHVQRGAVCVTLL